MAFNSNIFSYNYGHYVVLGYFFFYFIFFCVYIIKGLEPIIIHIPQELLSGQSALDEIPPPKTRNIKKISMNVNNLHSKNQSNDNDTKSKLRKSIRNNNTKKKSKRKSKNLKIVNDDKNVSNDAPPRKKSILNTRSSKSNLMVFNVSNKYLKNEKDNGLKLPKKRITGFEMFESITEQNKKEYDNFELNNMEYKEALENDHRKFHTIYWSILRREHLVIFSLFIRNDYNLTFVKICRLFFSLAYFLFNWLINYLTLILNFKYP